LAASIDWNVYSGLTFCGAANRSRRGIAGEDDLSDYVHSERAGGLRHLPIEREQLGFAALSDCDVERVRRLQP
jgi:hypothetical protein